MEINILHEAGYEYALRGMAYSYKDRALPVEEWWKGQFAKSEKRAKKLCKLEGGHSNFLESIMVWIDIEAPRYWWSEFDTYRVGTTKQSESTMHTLKKRDLELEDFEGNIPWNIVQSVNARREDNIQDLKGILPEAYLQRRLVVTNYKVLKNIIAQRYDHRLPQWQVFVQAMKNLEHPELLPELLPDYETSKD